MLLLLSPLTSTLFPYTTLFRSRIAECSSGGFSTKNPTAKSQRWHQPTRQTRDREFHVQSSQQNMQSVGTGTRVAFSRDRKSTRLNSSHLVISYAVFCLKKKNTL